MILSASSPRMTPSSGRLVEARLGGLGHVIVALPALELELEGLNRHGARRRVEIGEGDELRRPASIELVGEGELPGLVVDFEHEVLAEVLERYFRAEARPVIPHLVRPLLELDVVGDSALERDRVIFGLAGRLARARRVAALAVLDHFRRALERADLADPGDIVA